MSILVVDNGPFPRLIKQASWIRSYLSGVEAEIVYAVDNRIPREPERYDGVILSGGVEPLFSEAPFLVAELKLIEKCAEKKCSTARNLLRTSVDRQGAHGSPCGSRKVFA